VHQLVDLGVLGRSAGDRPTLHLNEASVEVLRGERRIELIEPKVGRVRKAKVDVESWEGVDRELFEELRELRRAIAQERGVPPYVIFSDRSLRAMARFRPTHPAAMSAIPGVGEKKLADLGDAFMQAIERTSTARSLETNLDAPVDAAPRARRRPPAGRGSRETAMELLAQGAPLGTIADETNRAPSTVVDDCCAYIERERPASIEAWVPEPIRARVRTALNEVGGDRLKPIHDRLGGNVPYDLIKIVVAHARAGAQADGDVHVDAESVG
jgi:ATP-dependent DNA helicase RecQ